MNNRASFGLVAFSMFALCIAAGSFLCLALPADAERRSVANAGHANPGFNISLGRQTHGGQQAFKGLEVPLRRPSTTPSAPADLPIFVNPLKRKHMALLPGSTRPAIEMAERL